MNIVRILLALAILMELFSVLILFSVSTGLVQSTTNVYQLFVLTSGSGIILLLGAAVLNAQKH